MTTLNAIRETFFLECEDLLEALAEGLSRLHDGSADAETVNAVFRAVHSIKGGAGAFGLDHLVSFAHRFETLMDEIRSDRVALNDDILHILQRSADHLADLVEAARENRDIDTEITAAFRNNLDQCLATLGIEEAAVADPSFGFEVTPLVLDLALPETAAEADIAPGESWQITLHPLPALFANGHDPIYLISGLSELGRLHTTPIWPQIPAFDGYLPDAIWLSWDAILTTALSRSDIEAYFEFVTGLCRLTISRCDSAMRCDFPAAASTEAGLPSPPVPVPLPVPAQTGAEPISKASADGALVQTTPPSRTRRLPQEEDGEARNPKPTLRVDLERVDRLINAVGELIINQAMIEQSILDLALPTDAEVITHTEDYRLFARDLQEAVMAIRAQPVKPLFQRMSRSLREVAEATGKSTRLITHGEATEVDKTVIERLTDPLTHMIRNAVDHGLESREARIAAGKDPEGTIRLSAAHRSGTVVITLGDDGAGLDRPKIQAKAIARNLISADAELTDAEIDNLVFMPGFSTADRISNLSGRGVGLDVVKNAVTALGGRVSITSIPGQGSEFTIALPLTLAVMDGMVISVAGQTMVIPIASVIETIRPGPHDLHLIGTQDNLLSIRGRFLPMIDVAQCLGFPARDAAQPPLLLLVETEAQSQCALIVDAVLDQRQVVIKGLETNYGSIPGVSAATVLGDGQIALILDAEALTANRAAGPQSRPSSLNTTGISSHAIH